MDIMLYFLVICFRGKLCSFFAGFAHNKFFRAVAKLVQEAQKLRTVGKLYDIGRIVRIAEISYFAFAYAYCVVWVKLDIAA